MSEGKVKRVAKFLGKFIGWTVAVVIGLVLIFAGLLYVPFFQDWLFPIALREVSKATEMQITASQIRLRFPLNLTVRDALVVESTGDTMLVAGEVYADVKLRPLFSGNVEATRIHAYRARYNIGNADSAMCLRAELDKAVFEHAGMVMSNMHIDLQKGSVDGCRVDIALKDTITPPTPPSPDESEMLIKVHELSLKNVTYNMQMAPTIDSLNCSIGNGMLKEAVIDMKQHTITGDVVDLSGVNASYLVGTGEPKVYPDSLLRDTFPPGPDWLIKVAQISLQADRAEYVTPGSDPLASFRFSDVKIGVDSFMNCGTAIKVPLRELSGHELRGVDLSLSGLFEMDSTVMRASSFKLNTPQSWLDFSASMGMLEPFERTPIQLLAQGEISVADVKPFLEGFSRLIPDNVRVPVNLDLDGSMQSMNFYRCDLGVSPYLSMSLQGIVNNLMDMDHIEGHLGLEGSLSRPLPKFLQKLIPLPTGLKIPVMKIKGGIDYMPGDISGDIQVLSGKGKLAASGTFKQTREAYDASLDLTDFPVDAFMPEYGVGRVTASLKAHGQGFDIYSPKTQTTVNLELGQVEYKGEKLADIYVDLTLQDRHATLQFDSYNPEADLSLSLATDVIGDTIKYKLDTDVSRLNLRALRLTTDTVEGAVRLLSDGWVRLKPMQFQGSVKAQDVDFKIDSMLIVTPEISLTASALDTITGITLTNGDMALHGLFYKNLFKLMPMVSDIMPTLDKQMKNWEFAVDTLQKALPPMDLSFVMGQDNLLAEMAFKQASMQMKRVELSLHNDSLVSGNLLIDSLVMGKTRLDQVSVDLKQHGKFLLYKAMINNEPGTMDDFAKISLNGYLSAEKLSAFLKQENIKGEKGFALGFNVQIEDSVATLRFQPYNPTIAYMPWRINPDNFVSYDLRSRRLQADLALEDDRSYLKLFTRPNENVADSTGYDQVVLQISKIRLQDWLSVSPFAPPIKGDLNGDMAFSWNGKDITGAGTVGVKNLFYGRDRVGDFDLGVDLKTNTRGVLTADVSLMVDSVKTITARGAINDSTAVSPFLLDFSMVRFPLKVVNPFLPPATAKLSGMLNGNMTITGDMAHPRFDGYLDFDTTEVKVAMLGTAFRFSEEKIPVKENVVFFNDFSIWGTNKNPMTVNGQVDVTSFANPKIDLDFKAQGMQIVNSNRPRGAEVYGKASIDLDAGVHGDMQRLDVNADLALLEGSSVTYVIPDATAAIASQGNTNMVHFVALKDTAEITEVDTIQTSAMALNLQATLSIRPQTTVTVDLSADGKNRVQLQGAGTLDFAMSPLNGESLIGKLYILGGFVRYSPPLMSEKRFDFTSGSFVNFTGDMLNPQLNIKAVDKLKANVTQKGQNSRLVNFDILLSVTGTLETMKVAFDLTTDDDITVQNELQSMSPEQRANQAMNMLLYNVYTGAGTSGNANLSGNPLYAFLESTLNTWMANNIRGVDISFGIDQYDKTYEGSSTTATSYSYQVSKTLFDDRFKIVVGGNYSTDANADENFSQNLINDISFEYMLNKSGSMYVKLFRHTGFISILEGEVTQTGVGFVIKRSLNSLMDLFRFSRSK